MKWLNRLEEWMLVALFSTSFGILAIQVICRNLFSFSISWGEELARFTFVWMVFIGASYTLRIGGHIAIHALIKPMPRKLQTAILAIGYLITIIFMAVLAYQGFILTSKVSSLPTIAMEISSSWEYGAVPVGATLITIRAIILFYETIKHGLTVSQENTLL